MAQIIPPQINTTVKSLDHKCSWYYLIHQRWWIEWSILSRWRWGQSWSRWRQWRGRDSSKISQFWAPWLKLGTVYNTKFLNRFLSSSDFEHCIHSRQFLQRLLVNQLLPIPLICMFTDSCDWNLLWKESHFFIFKTLLMDRGDFLPGVSCLTKPSLLPFWNTLDGVTISTDPQFQISKTIRVQSEARMI